MRVNRPRDGSDSLHNRGSAEEDGWIRALLTRAEAAWYQECGSWAREISGGLSNVQNKP